MFRDFYWDIEGEQIYLYCPLVNNTIKNCVTSIENLDKLLGECSIMVKYPKKNV